MKSFFAILLTTFLSTAFLATTLLSCAHHKTAEDLKDESSKNLDFDPEVSASTPSAKSTTVKPIASKDTKMLERLNKAMEDYVFRRDSKDLTVLCQDLRLDCFVDNKVFPAKRKKVKRTAAPIGTGSKLGLQGENRVQVRYELFP